MSLPTYPTGQWIKTSLLMGYTKPGKEFTTCNMFWKPQAPFDFASFDFSATASDFYTSLITGIAPCLGNDAQVIGINIRANDGTVSLGYTKYQTTVGTVTGGALPEFLAAVVALQTIPSFPERIGHVRLAGIGATLVDGNYLTSAGNTALTNWATQLSTDVSSGGDTWQPVVFHRKVRATSVVLSSNVISLVGSNRHRKPRF